VVVTPSGPSTPTPGATATDPVGEPDPVPLGDPDPVAVGDPGLDVIGVPVVLVPSVPDPPAAPSEQAVASSATEPRSGTRRRRMPMGNANPGVVLT
jgi:hypothetical protein